MALKIMTATNMVLTKRKPGRPALSAVEKDEIRENIIQIARELFVNEGYENTSMRKIAAQAGFAPTKIYYYFENKKQILKHFWRDISADMWAFSRPSSELLVGEPLNIIRHMMRKNIEYWIDNPQNYHLLVETQDSKSDPGENIDLYNSSGSKEYIDALKSAVQRCMQAGTFRQDDVLFVCQLITVSTYGVYGAFYSLSNIAWVNKERMITDSIENTLRGLTAK